MVPVRIKISDDVCDKPGTEQPVGKLACDETRQSARYVLTLKNDRVSGVVPDLHQASCPLNLELLVQEVMPNHGWKGYSTDALVMDVERMQPIVSA